MPSVTPPFLSLSLRARLTLPRLLWACLLCLGLAASPGSAATLDGTTLPDTFPVDGRTLVLNGIGLRTLTVFSVHIYVAALYVTKPSHDAAEILHSTEPKVIVLRFIHGGSKADVEKEYREGERVNCAAGGCNPADAGDFDQLIAAAPAVVPGDTSTYIFADGGVEVLANGKRIAKFTNPDLAYRLLAGFIGDHPPSQALRTALLGLPPSD